MGIFGVQAPKFIGSNGTTVLLDNAVIIKNEPDYRTLTQESEIDKSKNIIGFGYHWLFVCKVYLYKYATPTAKLNEIMPYLFDTVTLYPHRENPAIKDSSSVVIPFVLEKIVPATLNTPDKKDTLILTFRSTKLVDITKSAL